MRKFDFVSPTRRPLVSSTSAVVAISVKNESEPLPACLNALAKQKTHLERSFPRHEIGILVFANNCDDDSAQIVRWMSADSPFEIRIVEAELPAPQAHAGAARRAAMDLASAWLVELQAFDGVILSTDADSQVAPDWIAANLDAFARGAEAVLGSISLDEEGEPSVPMMMRQATAGSLPSRAEVKASDGYARCSLRKDSCRRR